MRSITRAVSLPSAGLVLILCTVVAYQAIGQRPGMAAPTAVATVNLGKVLESLEQRADAETALQKLTEEILARDDQWQAEIKDMSERYEALPATDAVARRVLADEILLKGLEYQEWRKFKFDQIDVEKSLRLRDLYQSVQEAIRELSDVEGYHLVLMDDSTDVLSVNPEAGVAREIQVRQQMTGRRVLYAGDAVDITDELIERMNNAW